ncbi:prepilin peptidase [Microbacterium sp.]|uniref:prepilin peptidase n=1 Tax=Microbacterium sp. TaxID=51671 RepID=UPI003A9507F0
MTMPVLVFALVFTGVLGLVIGSFLNVVAYREPAGIPLTRESRCPECDCRVRPWQNVPVLSWLALRGRCAHCNSAISPRYPIVELFTGAAFAGVAWAILAGTGDPMSRFARPMGEGGLDVWLPPALALVAFLYLAAISIVLTLIDIDVHRLPNTIVLPSYVVAIVLLGASSLLAGDVDALIRAGGGMVAMYLFYAILRFIRPAGMGAGDVKFAGVLGLYLGWTGWTSLIVGGFAAFVLGGVFGVALMLSRRANRRTAIPFGPWMIVGAWVGIFVGPAVGTWYLGLLHA